MKAHGTLIWTKRNNKNQPKQQPLERFPLNQRKGGQARLNRDLGERRHGATGPLCWHNTRKEEGDSAIPSSQRQAAMGRGHSPEGEEVVMDTSQVVVGTSQKGEVAVGCQPTRS